jgi:Txe/YoeB family toxin of Txe-Axe toxin-antitoxin module
MTIHQEIRKILLNEAKEMIEKKIAPDLSENITRCTYALIEKMTKLDKTNLRHYSRVYNRIHRDLISQMIRHLIKMQYNEK